MAPTCMQLQNLSQKKEESFKEYVQRWRELASRVQPPLLEKELVDMFMGTFQGVVPPNFPYHFLKISIPCVITKTCLKK